MHWGPPNLWTQIYTNFLIRKTNHPRAARQKLQINYFANFDIAAPWCVSESQIDLHTSAEILPAHTIVPKSLSYSNEKGHRLISSTSVFTIYPSIKLLFRPRSSASLQYIKRVAQLSFLSSVFNYTWQPEYLLLFFYQKVFLHFLLLINKKLLFYFLFFRWN